MGLLGIRISWKVEVQPRAMQGPHAAKDLPFHTKLLTFTSCRSCMLSGKHIATSAGEMLNLHVFSIKSLGDR